MKSSNCVQFCLLSACVQVDQDPRVLVIYHYSCRKRTLVRVPSRTCADYISLLIPEKDIGASAINVEFDRMYTHP